MKLDDELTRHLDCGSRIILSRQRFSKPNRERRKSEKGKKRCFFFVVAATLREKSHAFINAHPSVQRVNSERPAGGKGGIASRMLSYPMRKDGYEVGNENVGKAELGKLSASFQSVASN